VPYLRVLGMHEDSDIATSYDLFPQSPLPQMAC